MYEKRQAPFTMRIDPDLRAEVTQAAKEERVSEAAWIKGAILVALRARQRLAAPHSAK